ncbi:uncharacterized protein Dvar_69360 [Desulfosarcina variabilis str. Montpellier]|uniref:hypothetical protein n=1 Tax=Desulfosarcina variabilis TaxID=2300 RepID=UPI003AFA744A
MDANTVFKRNTSTDYSLINQNPRLIRAFLAIDGKSSLETIASTNNYEIDALISIVDQIEKMGLITPEDDTQTKDDAILSDTSSVESPAEGHTQIEAAGEQHHGNRTYIFRGVRVEE